MLHMVKHKPKNTPSLSFHPNFTSLKTEMRPLRILRGPFVPVPVNGKTGVAGQLEDALQPVNHAALMPISWIACRFYGDFLTRETLANPRIHVARLPHPDAPALILPRHYSSKLSRPLGFWGKSKSKWHTKKGRGNSWSSANKRGRYWIVITNFFRRENSTGIFVLSAFSGVGGDRGVICPHSVTA